MNNNTINLIIKLKNASLSRKEKILVNCNSLSESLIKILYKEGFIQSFKVVEAAENDLIKNKKILVIFRYFFNKPLLSSLRVLSKPSHVRYMKFSDISNISDKKFVFFFSTNKGILTSVECKKRKVGGKLLFMC
jgi:small subunit ribosomal protein S8